jgi:Flp pilus assembly secretin CpaC
VEGRTTLSAKTIGEEGRDKMTSTHKALLVSLIGFSISSICHAQQVEMQALMLGHVQLFKTNESFTSILIGDPKIVDVTATSDRTATLTALMTGTTNVLFLDSVGNRITEFEVVVTEPQQSRVRVHNNPQGLSGFSSYRCGPTFCDLIDEYSPKGAPGSPSPGSPSPD